MAVERLKLDENSKYVLGGVTNNAALEPRMLRVDPTTNRLLVDTSVTGSVGALDQFDLATSNPLSVAIVDGTGAQITSFGGGTQYTEGDTDSTITGTALMMEDLSNTLQPAPGDKTNGLDVDMTRPPADLIGTGSITGNGQSVILNLQGANMVTFDLSGTFTATLQLEASIDGTTWIAIPGLKINAPVLSSPVAGNWSSANNSQYIANVSGYGYVRFNCTAYTSGTAVVYFRATSSSNPFFQPITATNFTDARAVVPSTNHGTPWFATMPFLFNSSTYDRLRSIVNATNSTGTGIMAMGMVAQFDDVSPTAITENQFGNVRMSTNRNLYGTLRDAAGNERGLNISSRSAALIEGVTASGVAIASSPITTGGQARTTNPTAVTDGQVVNGTFDKLGKQVVVGSIRDLKGVQQTTITSSTSETTIVTAVASTFLDLYGLIITNTSATVTKVTIKDSTTGTTRAVIEIPATETRGFMLPESGGIPQATVNNNWTATCGTSVASIEITALYVKNT